MKRKLMWADPLFISALEKIKLKRMLAGERKMSIQKLTKRMLESKKFAEMEKELLEEERTFLKYE